ncbi:hypothetical protein DVH24_040521 [Malus domestica]|uniref:Uncharacterized protein n=1 Tax=Malus domestica TaxID=3750 RepID=A0A498IAY2_MALDO|nr:hypothetical protein DVH24_040521 [Malus domestica]
MSVLFHFFTSTVNLQKPKISKPQCTFFVLPPHQDNSQNSTISLLSRERNDTHKAEREVVCEIKEAKKSNHVARKLEKRQCTRFVRVFALDSAFSCPHYKTGFLEEIETMPQPLPQPNYLRRRFSSSHCHYDEPGQNLTLSSRRVRRASGDRSSPFNPVIVLRSIETNTDSNSFELYYNDATGSRLHPLPPTIFEFLMGSEFDRLLDQQSFRFQGSQQGMQLQQRMHLFVLSMPMALQLGSVGS